MSETLLAQARTGIDRLRADRHDEVGRGLLAEAWQALSEDQRPDWLLEGRRDLLLPALPDLPIHTDRLVLRLPTEHDAGALHELFGREDVAQYLLFDPFNLDRARTHVATYATPAVTDESLHLKLLTEHEGRVVGELTLVVKGPEFSVVEIGWAVHPDASGKGLVTEGATELLRLAFGHFGAHRVIANLDARNERSEALCIRIGMRVESRTARDWWTKGEWSSSVTCALMREDWPGA